MAAAWLQRRSSGSRHQPELVSPELVDVELSSVVEPLAAVVELPVVPDVLVVVVLLELDTVELPPDGSAIVNKPFRKPSTIEFTPLSIPPIAA